jgi:hypothetical protein
LEQDKTKTQTLFSGNQQNYIYAFYFVDFQNGFVIICRNFLTGGAA